MSTNNIRFYKEVKKKYTGCNLKTTEFLDCVLIGVCAVIRSNKEFFSIQKKTTTTKTRAPQGGHHTPIASNQIVALILTKSRGGCV